MNNVNGEPRYEGPLYPLSGGSPLKTFNSLNLLMYFTELFSSGALPAPNLLRPCGSPVKGKAKLCQQVEAVGFFIYCLPV